MTKTYWTREDEALSRPRPRPDRLHRRRRSKKAGSGGTPPTASSTAPSLSPLPVPLLRPRRHGVRRRAGTLRRAARDARALLSRRRSAPEKEVNELDARVAALVRMLDRKGKAGMVHEVLAEFAAICDHLLPRPPLLHFAY